MPPARDRSQIESDQCAGAKLRNVVAAAGLVLIATAQGVASDAELPGRMSDAALRERGYVSLVDAALHDVWDVKPWHQGHWTFRDSMIDYDGRADHAQFEMNSLWTKESYANVAVYAEWRLPAKPRLKPHPIVLFNGDFLMNDDGKRVTRPRLDAGDSGILFRGTSRCQANIWSQELGSGEINGYRTDSKMPAEIRRACIPIRKADRPLGEWNVFVIRLDQDRMTVVLNGDRVIDAVPLPDLPSSGPIGLQHHGDAVQFRRLWVKALE